MPQRIQLQRTRGWRMPPGAVKVDRSTSFGNPFVIMDGVTDAAFVAAAFRRWLDGEDPSFPERRAALLRRLSELRGNDLACWCKPGAPCHADVLLELANAGPQGVADDPERHPPHPGAHRG
jgi:hypothetical protein